MDDRRQRGAQFLLTTACFVIVIAGMKAAASIIIPVLLAAFVSIICSPVFLWLVKRRVPAIIAVLFIIVLLSGSVAMVGTMVRGPINDFTAKTSEYKAALEEQTKKIAARIDDLFKSDEPPEDAPPDGGGTDESPPGDEDGSIDSPESSPADGDSAGDGPAEDGSAGGPTEGPGVESPGEEANDGAETNDEDATNGEAVPHDVEADDGADDGAADGANDEQGADAEVTGDEAKTPDPVAFTQLETQTTSDAIDGSSLDELLNPRTVMSFFARMLSSVQNLATNAFLIMLIIVFILLEATTFPEKMRAVVHNDDTYRAAVAILADIRQYMGIKAIISFATGALATLLCSSVGVDFPFLWGLVAFLLNFIPTIGSLIAAVPPVLLALISNGTGAAFWTAFGYIAINVLLGNFLEPRIMGRGFGLSTLVVFLSLIFWGWVFGPVGMLLSVPLTMTAKIALANAEDTTWVALLLGSKAPRTLR